MPISLPRQNPDPMMRHYGRSSLPTRAFSAGRVICLVWYASKELTRSASAVNDWAPHRLGRTLCDRPSKNIEGRMAYSQFDQPAEVLCDALAEMANPCPADRCH